MVKTKKYKRKIGKKKGGEIAILTGCLISKAIHVATTVTLYWGLKYTALHNILGAYAATQGINTTTEIIDDCTDGMIILLSAMKGNLTRTQISNEEELKTQISNHLSGIEHKLTSIFTGAEFITKIAKLIKNTEVIINLITSKEEAEAIFEEGNYLAIARLGLTSDVEKAIRKTLNDLYYGKTFMGLGACIYTSTNGYLLDFFKGKIKEVLEGVNREVLQIYKKNRSIALTKQKVIDVVNTAFSAIANKQKIADDIKAKAKAENIIQDTLNKKEVHVTQENFNEAMDKYYTGGGRKKRQTRKIRK